MFCRAKKFNTIKFRDVFVLGWGWGKRMKKNCARLMIRAAAAFTLKYIVCFIQRGFYILELQRAEDVEILKVLSSEMDQAESRLIR